mmetsp:Transcript_49951/g.99464  ORF Transcript_49951/g.99464 Transcript_49951/m.99464 type:complete len:257 (-) Transcript_49951:862-1632(-)
MAPSQQHELKMVSCPCNAHLYNLAASSLDDSHPVTLKNKCQEWFGGRGMHGGGKRGKVRHFLSIELLEYPAGTCALIADGELAFKDGGEDDHVLVGSRLMCTNLAKHNPCGHGLNDIVKIARVYQWKRERQEDEPTNDDVRWRGIHPIVERHKPGLWHGFDPRVDLLPLTPDLQLEDLMAWSAGHKIIPGQPQSRHSLHCAILGQLQPVKFCDYVARRDYFGRRHERRDTGDQKANPAVLVEVQAAAEHLVLCCLE